jgi:predicted DNA-binding transcriptional regulator AlpA
MKSIFLSKKDVARKFNISPSTVFRWANDGIIPPPIRLGPNTICWDENELNEAIEEKKKDRGFLGHKPKKKK